MCEDNVETSPVGGWVQSQQCHHLESYQLLMSSFVLPWFLLRTET